MRSRKLSKSRRMCHRHHAPCAWCSWASSVSLILRLHPYLSCTTGYSFSAMYPRPSLLCRRPILCFALPLLLSLHYSEHHCLLKVSCRHPFWRHIQTGHIKDPHKRMMCGKGESGVGGERGGGDLGG